MMATGSMSAVVVGATGLVGRECVELLIARDDVAQVTTLTRRSLPLQSQQRRVTLRNVVVDFDKLDKAGNAFEATHVFCALGTTIKQAGSPSQFRAVDYGYALRVAELSLAAGVRHFLLVSSVGADSASRGFYLQVKGDLEAAVLALGFRSVTIVRPSLLLGDRAEFRFGEELAASLSWTFPRRYRPVHVRDVARVLVDAAVDDQPGVRIIENTAIHLHAHGYSGVAASGGVA